MKYTKPSLTFDEQADQLLRRGLVGAPGELVARLSSVSYYRLSAYWHTFRIPADPDDRLAPGTTMQSVWRRYVFDRQLRLVVMDAVERVEIALRTQLVNRHTLAHGPFGYLDRATLPGMEVGTHRQFLDKIRTEAKNSREDFVRHYFEKYTSETDLPLWMASELMTFGTMLTLFRHVEKPIKQAIANDYGVADVVLESWLLSLNYVRNICAHHARLWNRGMENKSPTIPRARKNPDWHSPVPITGDRIFGVLTVLHYLLRQVAPQSKWKHRLAALFAEYPDIPIRFMGFPGNWTTSPLWNCSAAQTEDIP